MAASTKLLKEAVYKLSRAVAILGESLSTDASFSLPGERAKELLTEAKSWLIEYVEEVKEDDGS